MELLNVSFSVSGVETNLFFPPLVAMVISFFTSMGGVSGAFLLLPFQMSVMNYTAPSVSGTNHVFNVTAIPSGVYRYIKEGRMAWPMTWVVIAGTLPGVFLGYYIRVLYLPDPRAFKFFVGCVLLYIGIRLVKDLTVKSKDAVNSLEEKFITQTEKTRTGQNTTLVSGIPADAVVRTISVSLKKVEYEFWGERFSFSTIGMFSLAAVVGIIGGVYGIGGGAIIAPFCVAVFRLPVYTIAGAALMGTFITSLAGAVFFTVIPSSGGISAMPDWPLGILFGAGGFAGVYLGARAQKFVPQRFIKIMLSIVIISVAARYILQFF
ncbi:MAG: sulfite exporter TauE/SafE family protein [Nitrospirae bacterium]|nr:MAG: sulfite exporter TauE/SafE family protein [Nitrospirota bacterium]